MDSSCRYPPMSLWLRVRSSPGYGGTESLFLERYARGVGTGASPTICSLLPLPRCRCTTDMCTLRRGPGPSARAWHHLNASRGHRAHGCRSETRPHTAGGTDADTLDSTRSRRGRRQQPLDSDSPHSYSVGVCLWCVSGVGGGDAESATFRPNGAEMVEIIEINVQHDEEERGRYRNSQTLIACAEHTWAAVRTRVGRESVVAMRWGSGQTAAVEQKA
jgi:hypothetical protein